MKITCGLCYLEKRILSCEAVTVPNDSVYRMVCYIDDKNSDRIGKIETNNEIIMCKMVFSLTNQIH